MKKLMMSKVVIILLCGIVCCGQNKNTQSKPKVFYDYSKTKIRDTSEVCSSHRYAISYKIYPSDSNDYVKKVHIVNNQKIENRFVNNKIDIIIYINSNIVFNKVLTKKDFSSIIDVDYLRKATLTHIDYVSVGNAGTVFNVSFCIPDTDLDNDIELVVDNNGKMKMKKIKNSDDF